MRKPLGLKILFVITALPVTFAIVTAWATNWNWNAASAVFTAAMTAATMWVAWEARASREEAANVRKRQAFKSAIVEITSRNQLVVGIIKGVNAKGKIMRDFLLHKVESGIEYLSDYPETVGLLRQVEVPARTLRYVLGAVHKMKGLVASIEEEIGKALEIKGDPTGPTLRRLKYLHLILIQLGRVLLAEAQRQGIGEAQEWQDLVEPSPFAGDLEPENVSSAVAVYPPLGELHLPPGKEYERLGFPELVEEARRKKPEPVDQLLGTRGVKPNEVDLNGS